MKTIVDKFLQIVSAKIGYRFFLFYTKTKYKVLLDLGLSLKH